MTVCCVMLCLLRKQIVCCEVRLRIVFVRKVILFTERDIDDVLLRFFTRHCDGGGGFIGVW